MWQERRGTGQGVATELGPVDFATVARGLGARGVRVDRDADVEGAIRQAMVEERPTVIQLALDQPLGLGRRGRRRLTRRPSVLPNPALRTL